MRSSVALVSFALVAFLTGCSDDDDGGGGAPASTSFSGTILGQPGGPFRGLPLQGLEGAIVAIGAKQATTDADGNFIVLQPPGGMQILHVDGSGVAGGTFAGLEIAVVVGGGATNLTQPLVLPNLDFGVTVPVATDVNGVTTMDASVGDPMLDGFRLDIPMGTTITDHGVPVAGSVDINVTPVAAIDVPMPLPGTLNPGAFVTIQPPGAAFSPALGITLPNTGNFPLGAMVDIWSFDHDEAQWVNRSEETGNVGTVVDIGGSTFVVADQVITEGGWHAGVLPVDPDCATDIEGQVFAQEPTSRGGTPVRDVLISLSTGQFAVTDAEGRFSIPSVPAYDAGLLPDVCMADDLELRAIAPVSHGSGIASMTIPAGTIVTGGTTVLAPFDIPVSSTGSLVGSVSDASGPVQGEVSITGTASVTLQTAADGTFFKAALEPGDYTASFTFASQEVDTEPFTIVANQVTVVNLVEPGGSGSANVTVQVLGLDDDAFGPIAGACVTLEGAGGVTRFMTTDTNGAALFTGAPAGPYDVTAQIERPGKGFVERLAASVLGVNATGNPPTIVVPFFDDLAPGGPVVTDATLDVTLQNEPVGLDLMYQAASSQFFAEGPAAGGFVVDIPSDVPIDLAVYAVDPADGAIVSGHFAADIVATSGQTVMRDFDFASASPFDQTVSFSYTGEQAGHDEFSVDLSLGDLSFAFGDGQSLPATVDWPNLAASKFAALDAFCEAGSFAFSGADVESTFCELFLGDATPSTIPIAFLGIPTIQAPQSGANLPTFGPGSVVQYTPGSGNGATAGFDFVLLVHESEELVSLWNLFVAPGAGQATLPPVFAGKPMFADGFAGVTVQTIRFDFPGFVFANFFDADFPAKVVAFTEDEICGATKGHFFTIGSLPFGASDRASLRRRMDDRRALIGR